MLFKKSKIYIRTCKTLLHVSINIYMYIYMLLKKSKSYIKTFKTLLHISINIYKYIYILRSLKFTLKHLKCSYIFRSHHHPQGAYIVPC